MLGVGTGWSLLNVVSGGYGLCTALPDDVYDEGGREDERATRRAKEGERGSMTRDGMGEERRMQRWT